MHRHTQDHSSSQWSFFVSNLNRPASRFVWSGTHLGNFPGIPASGNKVTMYGMVFDKLVDGKMLESRILMDTMQLLTQLGAIPAPA